MKIIAKIKFFLKQQLFLLICFLCSIPLLSLGIYSIVIYQPSSRWQIENISWIRPIGLIFFIIIVEFIIVVIPTLMIRLKNKNNNTIDIFNKRNLKKEYVFNLTSFKIALSQAKVNKNYSEIKNLRKQFHQYKDEYHRKLKAFRIQK